MAKAKGEQTGYEHLVIVFFSIIIFLQKKKFRLTYSRILILSDLSSEKYKNETHTQTYTSCVDISSEQTNEYSNECERKENLDEEKKEL